MGLAVLIEKGHSSELDFAQALLPLALFGLIHGSHEWFEMALLIYPAFAGNQANQWIPVFQNLYAGILILDAHRIWRQADFGTYTNLTPLGYVVRSCINLVDRLV